MACHATAFRPSTRARWVRSRLFILSVSLGLVPPPAPAIGCMDLEERIDRLESRMSALADEDADVNAVNAACLATTLVQFRKRHDRGDAIRMHSQCALLACLAASNYGACMGSQGRFVNLALDMHLMRVALTRGQCD
jgi:hypothetical protein